MSAMSSVAISGSNRPTSTIALLRNAQTAPETVRIRPQTRWARRSTETIEANSVAWTLASSDAVLVTCGLPATAATRPWRKCADQVAQRVRLGLDVGVDDRRRSRRG